MDGDGSNGENVTTTPGEVTVSVTATPATRNQRPGPRNSADRSITAEVGNGTGADIFVDDMHTACSIAALERRVNAADDVWEAFEDCGSERLPRALAIGPGRGRTVRIDLSARSADGHPVPPGTYRLSVAWSTSEDGADRTVATSAPFEIG
jgi:hypothetical protein